MKQYGIESGEGDGPSKKNLHGISEGRGTKGPSLHGKHTLEDKRGLRGIANQPDPDDDMALEVRKAVALDYLEGGGDGKGDSVSECLSEFKSDNPEWILHSQVDELYPKA